MDVINRQDAINTALDFFVDFLDGAVHEDDQKIFIKRINELPSAEEETEMPLIEVDKVSQEFKQDFISRANMRGEKDERVY